MNGDLITAQQQICDLELRFNLKLAQIQSRLELSEHRLKQSQRRLRAHACAALIALTLTVLIAPASRTVLAQDGPTLQQLVNRLFALERRVSAQNTRLTVVEGKTRFMSADATALTTTFTGCNVYIQSGSGSTSDGTADQYGNPTGAGSLTGLGNLTVGYNAMGNALGAGDIRVGSHNLIVGDLNNYGSFGGLVIGDNNAIMNAYATVSGGTGNVASGSGASVSGGSSNTALGRSSTVSGGNYNTAVAIYSCVSGGLINSADGIFSSVSGGISVTDSDEFGWAAGAYHSP